MALKGLCYAKRMARISIQMPAFFWALVAAFGLLLFPAAASSQDCTALENALPDTATQLPGLNADSIRMLNWNIQKASRDGWIEDLQRLATGSDLVLLQEAVLEAQLREKLVGDYHAVFAPGYTTSNYRSGVMTVSRVPPQVYCNLSHMEPWLGSPKATSVSRYRIEGHEQALLVINVHGVNFTLNSSALAQQLHDATRLIEQHAGPVIFSGDFNTWSDGRMAALEAVAEQLSLMPLDYPDDRRTQVFGNVLDHIYVRGLKVLSSGSVEVTTSDHNPVFATLALQ